MVSIDEALAEGKNWLKANKTLGEHRDYDKYRLRTAGGIVRRGRMTSAMVVMVVQPHQQPHKQHGQPRLLGRLRPNGIDITNISVNAVVCRAQPLYRRLAAVVTVIIVAAQQLH